MAIHTELPIHKSGSDLLTMGYWLKEHMPRQVKQDLGQAIVKHCMAMLEMMAMANASRGQQRVEYLERLMVHKRTVQALLRVGKERRAIALKHWARAVELLECVGKQCGGWIKATNRAPAA